MVTARMIACPKCKKHVLYSEENAHRPFCSSLCKMQDIGAWAYEEYRVAGELASPEDVFEHLNRDEDQNLH